MSGTIFYAEQEGKLFIRCLGRMASSLCYHLRERINERLSRKPRVEGLFVDLCACEYMDSTFLGLLVGFDKQLKREHGSRLSVVAPSAVSRQQLADLNLTEVLTILADPIPFPARLDPVSACHSPTPELLLKAHEQLMEVSEANRKKFGALESLLKKKLPSS